jgi:hypothetical protein
MWNISIEASNFNKNTADVCSYSFVVKNGNYTFSATDITEGLRVNQLPMVLDWTVGNLTENCSTASSNNNGVNYMCKSNSDCHDNDTAFGYLCRCKDGYDGNPYHPLGCTGQLFIHPSIQCYFTHIFKQIFGSFSIATFTF